VLALGDQERLGKLGVWWEFVVCHADYAGRVSDTQQQVFVCGNYQHQHAACASIVGGKHKIATAWHPCVW
jgi:hypothetical protein